jgi:hypothetical protein
MANPGMETIAWNFDPTTANSFQEWEKTLPAEIGKKKGQTTKVMWIEAITIEWYEWDAYEAQDADEQMIQITTNSESAEVKLSDKDCFFKRRESVTNSGTAAVDQHWENIKRYEVKKPYIKKEMFIAVDSTGLAAGANVSIQIDYRFIYVSDYSLNRMVSRSY